MEHLKPKQQEELTHNQSLGIRDDPWLISFATSKRLRNSAETVRADSKNEHGVVEPFEFDVEMMPTSTILSWYNSLTKVCYLPNEMLQEYPPQSSPPSWYTEPHEHYEG